MLQLVVVVGNIPTTVEFAILSDKLKHVEHSSLGRRIGFVRLRVNSWIVLSVTYSTIYEITRNATNIDLVWRLNCELDQSFLPLVVVVGNIPTTVEFCHS